MNEINFPFPKVNRPKKTGDAENDTRLNEVFDRLEGYLKNIKPFIFTDIKLIYDQNDDRVILSRIQQNLSNVLLRSLYIRNGIVDSINSRNTVALFSNLKSFIEVPAMLAHLLSIIDNKDLKTESVKDSLSSMALGNRGSGSLRVGHLEAVNVTTMFKKLDNFINKLGGKKSDTDNTSIMSDFYDLVCNSSHPNYDAHDIIATFEPDKEQWRGFLPDELKYNFVFESARYTPPIVLAIVMTETLANTIFNSAMVDYFKKLDNTLYFEQTK